ncbi:hypothetical protein C5167_007944 [Papaver somniferum]|uniref:Uncharacterized protein n=1 Tax=Papaver somniferum TaxID=3469 RepID=A0A4Y7JWV3_PAPSO|nr:hypothetical protein C5167_007944 [Papaver somniferum]
MDGNYKMSISVLIGKQSSKDVVAHLCRCSESDDKEAGTSQKGSFELNSEEFFNQWKSAQRLDENTIRKEIIATTNTEGSKKLPHHTGMTEIRLGISLIFLMRMMKKEMPPKKALGDSILQNVDETPYYGRDTRRRRPVAESDFGDKEGKASTEGSSGFIETFNQWIRALDIRRKDSIATTNTEGSKIEGTHTSPHVRMRDKGKAVSVDNSRYDSTGKRLPINLAKQRERIPTVEGNIDVRANIIFLDRDYLEDSDHHILHETSSTMSPTESSTGKHSPLELESKCLLAFRRQRGF